MNAYLMILTALWSQRLEKKRRAICNWHQRASWEWSNGNLMMNQSPQDSSVKRRSEKNQW